MNTRVTWRFGEKLDRVAACKERPLTRGMGKGRRFGVWEPLGAHVRLKESHRKMENFGSD